MSPLSVFRPFDRRIYNNGCRQTPKGKAALCFLQPMEPHASFANDLRRICLSVLDWILSLGHDCKGFMSFVLFVFKDWIKLTIR